MTPDLARFTQMSQARSKMRFNALMGLLFRPEGLLASFENLAANKAAGVDGIQKEAYRENLKENLKSLSDRLRRLGYKPKPSRRVYIPKLTGGRRPLGIPAFEDRIVQDRLSRILQAIWEPEFRNCSFGFRPGRSAHDALKRVAKNITHDRTGFIVEADIKGFYDHVDHDHLMRFLEHRIGDSRFLRTIRRFLKAGIMEDGAFKVTDWGTPQGGLVSPVLSNVYLHYVLDWWFEGRFAKSCKGDASIVRYADDFLACFQYEHDAKRFMTELQNRLGAFGLEVEPSKTRMIRFGRFAQQHCHREGVRRPATFNFLGFTHFVANSRTGKFVVGRTTEAQRLVKKRKEIAYRLRDLRLQGGKAMVMYIQQHLRGHFQYYGVSGNSLSLLKYSRRVQKELFKWLNRRSQRKSITWQRFNKLLEEGLLPTPKVIHNLYPVPSRMI